MSGGSDMLSNEDDDHDIEVTSGSKRNKEDFQDAYLKVRNNLNKLAFSVSNHAFYSFQLIEQYAQRK